MRAALISIVCVAPLGCGEGAAVIEVRADDLAVPVELSSFCLAAWDEDLAGGEFARHYRFDDEVVDLPQTLTIEPGQASGAVIAARGYRAGIEVARDQAFVDFDGVDDVPLSLARCPALEVGAPEVGGIASVPGAVALAASFGRGGAQVIAIGDGVSERLDAAAGLAAAGQIPDAPPGATAIAAFDADGDCDDDVVVVSESAQAVLWRRAADGSFAIAGDGFAGGGPPGRAVAAADVDLDGDIDLAIGDAAGVTIWLNDGAARFAESVGAIATDADDVSALGFGDFDADGDADLLVGRGRDAPAPVRVLLGDGGRLAQVDAAAPPIDLSVTAIEVRDLDGDRVDDALLAIEGAAVRVLSGRGDGRLEDRSFLFFPSGPPAADAVAAADWDGDCLADSAIGAEAFRGSEAGLVAETTPDFGLAALFADLDGDGDADLLGLDAAGEVVWLRR